MAGSVLLPRERQALRRADPAAEGGFDSNSPKPLIELNGTNAGSGVSGLYIAATQCTVRALVVNRFSQSGIVLSVFGASVDTVQGCYLGTTADGSAAAANGSAGVAVSCSNNTIGGTTAGTGNLISGNSLEGVGLFGSSAKGNLVVGNRIGTTADGSAGLTNGGIGGVTIESGATNNTIGGTAAGAGNVISGNKYSSSGVEISDTGTTGNLVEGNAIGANAAGTAALANGSYGVFIWAGATNNTIGGTAAGTGNTISGNSTYGIYLYGGGSSVTTGNIIQGNRIGTTGDGSGALPNLDGIYEDRTAGGNTIGGSVAGAGNLISGNSAFGIIFDANGNVVQGNRLGTNAAGTGAVGNWEGVVLGSSSNTVGGTTAGASNTISGNKTIGVDIGVSNNIVEGNRIGTTADGSTALANGTAGIAVGASAVNNTIGGTTAGTANIISGNTQYGVDITDTGTTGNLLEGNDIGTNAAGNVAIPNGRGGV
ncbi:MAG TPA: hypothetical protein VGY66_26700, partial [Gemmataceae bacterium]|nr:hypothetical protein [Gemmataceae bacterium]